MERNKVYYSDLQRYKKAKEAEAEEKRKKQEEEKRKIERELEHGPSGTTHFLGPLHCPACFYQPQAESYVGFGEKKEEKR